MRTPTTRYAKSGEVHVAYQVFGEGPIDLVFVPGFVSHIENYWTHPDVATWLERLGSFARVVMFDKRGTGLSDKVGTLPAMDERMDDVRTVMDAVGLEQAAIFGISEGGSLATVFAAHHPTRCTALILYGAFAQFKAWFPTEQDLEVLFQYIDSSWGSGESLPLFAPTNAADFVLKEWWGRFERMGADPRSAIDLMRMNSQIDITAVLPSVQAPTLVIHRTGDTTIDFDGGLLLAERIPNATLVALPGPDHLPWVGEDPLRIVDEIEQFLTGNRSTPATDRFLATILFTDIVGSTATATEVGDRRWANLLHAHDEIVRSAITHYGGKEIKSLGDGFLATFDAPGRAIRCGLVIREAVRRLGIEIRAGIHTGEIRSVNGDVQGLSVHVAARVAAVASPGEVFVTRTVKDLIAGSGLELEYQGVHELKGVEDEWQLYRARP